jgi:hypothetical protein
MQTQLHICSGVGIADAIEEIKAAMDMCIIGLGNENPERDEQDSRDASKRPCSLN